MKRFSLIFILLIAGCSTINNVTNEAPYVSFLGSANTTRDAFLCDDETLGFFKPEIGAELVINHGSHRCAHSNHIITVPLGAVIELKRIVRHTGYGLFTVKRWYVIGQYSVGDEHYYFVYQLPWLQDDNGQYMDIDEINVPWANGV